mgnify:FL=1
MSIGHVELGQRLRTLRKQASQTVVEVADAVGSTHGHVSQIELGYIKKPSNQVLQSLAKHFGMTVSELTGEYGGSELSPKAQQVAHWFDHDLSESGRSVVIGMMQEMRERS